MRVRSITHKHNQTVDQRFPCLNVESEDFTNVFGGKLINVSTCVLPTEDRESMEKVVLEIVADIVAYLKQNPVHGDSRDRIQIVIGWAETVRESGRQIYKLGLKCETMEVVEGRFVNGWWGEDVLR